MLFDKPSKLISDNSCSLVYYMIIFIVQGIADINMQCISLYNKWPLEKVLVYIVAGHCVILQSSCKHNS